MSVVKINAIRVPAENHAELERRFTAQGDSMREVAGLISFELLRPVEGDDRYFVYSRWSTEEAFDAWRGERADQAHAQGRRQPVSQGADLLHFDVVLSVPGPDDGH